MLFNLATKRGVLGTTIGQQQCWLVTNEWRNSRVWGNRSEHVGGCARRAGGITWGGRTAGGRTTSASAACAATTPRPTAPPSTACATRRRPALQHAHAIRLVLQPPLHTIQIPDTLLFKRHDENQKGLRKQLSESQSAIWQRICVFNNQSISWLYCACANKCYGRFSVFGSFRD